MTWDQTRAVYDLSQAQASVLSSTGASSGGGNVVAIAPGQSVQVVPETLAEREVVLCNVGNVPLVASPRQTNYPTGYRLPYGETVTFTTKEAIWITAPTAPFQEVQYTTNFGIVPIGYLEVFSQ